MMLDKFLLGKTIKSIRPHRDNDGEYKVDETDIEYDAGHIIIEFTDGVKIRCWNSEWGGIELLKENK